jgi:hypothetical protein
MGIYAHYRRMAPGELDDLLARVRTDPEILHELLFPEEPPRRSPAVELEAGRNWEALHTFLSHGPWAEEPALAASILGGAGFGTELCYGRPRYLTSYQVRYIAAAMAAVSEEALRQSFDADALNAVDPRGEWSTEAFPHLWHTFTRIRDFFQVAAVSRDAMLLYLG